MRLERHCSSGPIKFGIFDIYRSALICSQTVSDYHPLFSNGFSVVYYLELKLFKKNYTNKRLTLLFQESLIILLKAGADINALTEDGWTPLHSAARWNKATCVEILLNWGSDVNKLTVGNQTPLHLAAVFPDSSDTLQLLMLHPEIKPMIKNCQEDTPLDIAKRNSNDGEVFDLALPFFSCKNNDKQ